MSKFLSQFCRGVASDLRLLAFIHHQELNEERLEQIESLGLPMEFSLQLSSKMATEALIILNHGMADLRQHTPMKLDEHAADYAAIYLNHGYGISPCESTWLDEDGLTMQEPMFQVREWYGRFGLAAQDWRIKTDDHLANQLEFISHLFEQGSLQILKEAAQFMDEHILRWVMNFSRQVSGRCATPFYAGAAILTAAYLEELRDIQAQLLNSPRPSTEEIEKRMQSGANQQVEVPLSFTPGAAPGW